MNKEKNPTVKSEEKILDFWETARIFEKSVDLRKDKPFFSFYDGPPFATGQPHYGNLLPSAIKDTILRYKTMKGYYAPRRVGWDCHGLPIENLAEKELGQKCKADIEQLGVDKFNQVCRGLVFRSLDDIEKVFRRFGRWADYQKYYATIDSLYTESIWWIFKYLHQKGLVYKDYRTAPYCPRCGTPLSNFELNQPGAYKDIKDTSVFVKFPVKGEKNTFFLVWTTTPWTLPANFAIAVNREADYLKIKINKEVLILAEGRKTIIEEKFEELGTVKGDKLIGQEYEPIYSVPTDNPNDHKIVSADFVGLEEGTGLVHLAAFGLEDMEVAKDQNLSLKITVDRDGKMKDGYGLPGQKKTVWDADEDILNDLEKRNLLYRKLEIEHSYPFCWRCDERLIYYPVTSWYIAVEKFKDQLVENNKQINWVPDHLKEGRFGKWLEGARDWAVSRNRYWGAPLPVWVSEQGETIVIGSRSDLAEQKFTDNNYWLMRHGEAENNVKKILASGEENYPLTDKGREQVIEKAKQLNKTSKIDVILSSNTRRARETAETVGRILKIEPQFFPELSERNFGVADDQPEENYRQVFNSPDEYLTHSPEGGETGLELRQRIYRFVKEKDKCYQGKNILIISHRGPLRSLQSACLGLTKEEHTAQRSDLGLDLGEIRKMKLNLMPFNEKGLLDLHRPYVDGIEFWSPAGQKMKRIEEVFDCWYESGAMPYAQNHFPFENQQKTKESFPADFITEALEQTRGWFYTLHVLATALTLEDIGLGKNKPAFKNVIAHGLILSDSGEKLSKHLKNYTPPQTIIDRYGADALRFYFLSQSSLGGDYIVNEDKIKEIAQKIVGTFDNCAKFYLTYAPAQEENEEIDLEKHDFQLLDHWMLSRLHRVGRMISEEMDNYRVDRASRLFFDLIDDFSNWYIRRSRTRLQNQGSETKIASKMLGYFLKEISCLMAPFVPFVSEKIYQEIKLNDWPESVHMKDYFEPNEVLIDETLEQEMIEVRQIARLALQARAKVGQKVRQPLSELRVAGIKPMREELLTLIMEETNIKKISFVDSIEEQSDFTIVQEEKMSIALCHFLDSSLKEEGITREIIRTIQSLRKKAGLKPQDKITLYFHGSEKLASVITRNKSIIQKESRVIKIEKIGDKKDCVDSQEISLDGEDLYLAIELKDVC